MINQPIYIKFNNYRKPEFRINTEIIQRNKVKIVVKRSSNGISIPVLFQMNKTFNKLITHHDFPFKVAKIIKKSQKSLEFEYINGVTLLQKLENTSKNLGKEGCFKIYEDYFSKLQKIPKVESALTNEFTSVFGQSSKRGNTYEMIKDGLLDLNMDNLIINESNEWTLIDYEWTFDFPIPLRYVFYRSIYFSFLHLKQSLSNSITITEVEKYFHFSEKEIKEYLNWEANFQKYVSGTESDGETLTRNRTEIFKSINKTDTLIVNKIDFEDLNQRLNTQAVLLDSLEAEVQVFRAFQAGNIWKTLVKYRKIKNFTKDKLHK